MASTALIVSCPQNLLRSGLMRSKVDWEHPSNPSQGHHYVQLLAAFREELPSPTYRLTSALPVGQWALKDIDLAKAAIHLDLVNLMNLPKDPSLFFA